MAGGAARILSLLLLLLVLRVTHTAEGEEVRVFSLQPDIWESPRDDVYIRFNMSNQQVAASLTQFTICSRVYFTALTTLQVLLSYATNEDFSNAIMMYIIDGSHFFRYNNKPQAAIERLEVATMLRRWRHYCHVLSGDTYTVYVDGVALATSPIQVDNRLLPLNGTFIVGQEQDALSRRFDRQQILKGYVTQVNFWSFGLSETEVEVVAMCQKNLKGNIFSSDRDDVELLNVDVYTRPLREICLENENFLIFPEGRTFTDSINMCHLVGTEIYAPPNQNVNNKVKETLWEEDICGDVQLWIGITDENEEGIWRRVSDDEIITDIAWGQGQPDNSRQENCVQMDAEFAKWNDYNCNKNKACTICEERRNSPLYLRGLCKERLTEIMFETLGYSSSKPFFHGFHGLMITHSGNRQWILFDTVSNISFASLGVASDNIYPLGKHWWTLLSPVCDHPVGGDLELSLSACQDGEYMCDDGQCIDVAARCDDKDDCTDETDEDNCSVLKVPDGYRSFKPPRNADNSSQPLYPYLLFSFLRFLKIEDVQQAIHLEFIITLKWIDTRLKYMNIRPDMHVNKLSVQEVKEIWRPQLEFLNIKDGELKTLKDNVFVEKVNESLPADFNAVRMDLVYGGDAAMIIQQQHYSGSFVCTFDVFYYPFDVQQCSVLLQLSSLSKELVTFTAARSLVEFGQDSTLPTYIIGEFFAKEMDSPSRESKLEVGYTLTRRYTLIVLSVFMPSAMLLFVGYSTLYVKVQLLQVRLPVSLTTLLVLYTFFNQTSSSLPKTAYVKMIDVWFFFCIIMLFVIIILHVAVDCLDAQCVIRVGPNSGGLFSGLKSESLLRVTRLWVLPLAIFIFGCSYFAILLR